MANFNQDTLVRIYSQDNRDKFKKYLTEIDWNPVLSETDCNLVYGKFIEIFKKGYDLCFPFKKLSKKRLKKKLKKEKKEKKRVNIGIKQSTKTKRKLYRAWVRKPTEGRKLKHKKYKTILQKFCTTAEKMYFHGILSDTKASLKKLWSIFCPIINRSKRNKKQFIEKLVIDNKSITENLDIAKTLNQYFATIGNKLSCGMSVKKQPYGILGRVKPVKHVLRPSRPK